MACHETKHCPRCETPFECKVGSIALCQCSTINLTDAERSFISRTFDDCLCANCMMALKAEFHNRQFQHRLQNISQLFKKE